MAEAATKTSASSETARLQGAASDPRSSAWVSANAGSGKTHVLTQRVIRLMLAGYRPSAILCLTYTKAAASEMSNRVFERLSRWTSLDDDALAAEIEAMEGRAAGPAVLAEARRLFARALETPGGLKIQTIHAFCEALLHQFPLEANVAGHFSVLDDKAAKVLLAEARRELLTATGAEADGRLAAAFHDALAIAGEAGLDRLLDDIIARRTAIGLFLDLARRHGGIEDGLMAGMGIDPGTTRQSLAERAWPLAGVSDGQLAAYIRLANDKGGSKVQEAAYRLGLARTETDPVARLMLLRETFLKKTDEMPFADSAIFSTAMAKANAGLCELIGMARFAIAELWQQWKTFRMFEATSAALVLAERLIAGYERLKKARGFLDFEDFITRTEALLRKPDIGAWVHYKLDQGIDHILVDEAQDTSPAQWEIIRSLSSDFFTGDSARGRDRTIFAVGDEKQSIYSFQGARPERFAEEKRVAQGLARDSGKRFEPISLHVSFRSTEDVLTAVDTVFAEPDHARGLSMDGGGIQHVSNRIGQAGAVDIWETIAEEDGPEEDEDWLAPFDRLATRSAASDMARRIAGTIIDLVGRQTIISRDGPRLIEAGDILVLVRKRDSFAQALAKELKTNSDVPVAGTDRLVLASHIAIQDLMALGRFAVLPEDDLSLAALIKCPLINLGENELAALAAGRPAGQSVWEHLHVLSAAGPTWAGVLERLERWRDRAGALRVHDFYADLLGRDGGRRAFLARFGHEVSDVLDEFLNFALAHEQAGLPGLISFVATLERDSPEIKREQDKGRNEVRIMTVHASKGLEAPVVFLVDGGSKPFDKGLLPKLRLIPAGGLPVPVPAWVLNGDYQNALTAADDARLAAAAEEEYRRLLYVGMTRASDRLVLASYRKKRDVEGTWAKMTLSALSARGEFCKPAEFSTGSLRWSGYCWRQTDADATPAAAKVAVTPGERVELPARLMRPLPPFDPLPRPLSPSGAHAIIDETEGDTIVSSALFADAAGTSLAQIRGKIIHRLLQALPDYPPAERRERALLYLDRAMPQMPAGERTTLANQVLAIIDDVRVAPLFGPASQAEVSIMGAIRVGGIDHAVSGRIDRLAATDAAVIVADYKTNRVAPRRREDIPFAHRAQLALYREVLRPLYPGKRIECLLIYTNGPDLYSLSDEELEKALLDLSGK